jgi:hypothetical protein
LSQLFDHHILIYSILFLFNLFFIS